ncbi:MAG: tetratricopeptide repeat protein [Xanthomonadales bacterium]|nr:tetratricopeptide repeat protein [Xanthomonadales bacterium]
MPRSERGAARIAIAALAFLLPSMAAAQSARDRLDALEARMLQTESVLQGQGLAELSTRLDELAAQVRALRGELEAQAEEQVALRKRLAELTTTPTPATAAPLVEAAPVVAAPVAVVTAAPSAVAAAAPAPGPDTLGPVQRYQLAFEALRAADYPRAVSGFEDMITRYPDHALATNARYWLGRSLLLQNEPARAIESFAGALATGTLEAGRAADALLKKAQAELQLGRKDDARTTVGMLLERYPDGEPARQARALLTTAP